MYLFSISTGPVYAPVCLLHITRSPFQSGSDKTVGHLEVVAFPQGPVYGAQHLIFRCFVFEDLKVTTACTIGFEEGNLFSTDSLTQLRQEFLEVSGGSDVVHEHQNFAVVFSTCLLVSEKVGRITEVTVDYVRSLVAFGGYPVGLAHAGHKSSHLDEGIPHTLQLLLGNPCSILIIRIRSRY